MDKLDHQVREVKNKKHAVTRPAKTRGVELCGSSVAKGFNCTRVHLQKGSVARRVSNKED